MPPCDIYWVCILTADTILYSRCAFCVTCCRLMLRRSTLFETCNHRQRLAIVCIIASLTLLMNFLHLIAALPACKTHYLTGKYCKLRKQVAFISPSNCWLLLYHMPLAHLIFME